MRILDAGLLGEFERRLREQGAPAIEHGQPGLSEEAMRDLVSPLGLSLPVEARLWWGWHDGVPREAGAGPTEIGPGRKWLPLSEATAECARIRRMISGPHSPPDPRPIESIWSPDWLPLVHADGLYVIDTGVPDGAPCPVRVHWFYEPEAPHDLPSLGELVSVWIEAIDRGAWRYDRDAAHWTVDHEILDPWPPARRGVV